MKLRIKEAIDERGYHYKEVAEAIGITRQSMYHILKRESVSFNTLSAIAEYMGCTLDDLTDIKKDTPTMECPRCHKPIKVILS